MRKCLAYRDFAARSSHFWVTTNFMSFRLKKNDQKETPGHFLVTLVCSAPREGKNAARKKH
ncbi:MAG: hypothetical protein CVU77_02775 [Elusimicrobia bacterium HGW-Elusimicrobia-1]|nr:MAG: hypothetical protein CVU77_02775 [Elusimicrobia bacterium HGW-Elusimicrobia-1]